MFVRVLCCALCALFVSPAAAIVLIEEGDHFETFGSSDEILMTGGYVGRLRPDTFTMTGGHVELIECGAGHCGVTIDGGYVRYFTANYRGGDLTVRGRNGDPDMRFSTEGTTSLTVEGTYFRMFSRGTGGEKEGRIEGWLTNGGFIRLSYGFEPHTGQDSPVRVNIVPGRRPQTPGDTNYDDLVDLADLNNVRNHFGAAGDDVLGDSNQDGLVDLVDMNLIRNNFSRGPSDYFRLSLEDDEVREVTSSVQVPEPSTLALAGCIAIARWRYRRA